MVYLDPVKRLSFIFAMNRVSKYSVLAFLGILMIGAGSLCAEDFKTVTAEELKSSPKQYWATGIIFKDVLTAYPSGKKLQIEDEDFVAFQTRALGVCYADAPLAAALMSLPLKREYLFRGTVLTRNRNFYVVARRAAASFESLDGDKAAILESMAGRQPGAGRSDDPLNALLAEAYKAYFSYAEDIGVDAQQLFNRNPRYEEKLLGLIGEATRTVERQKKTTAQTILNRVVLEILAARYGQASAPGDAGSTAAGTGAVRTPPAEKPLAGQSPEFDASVFILKSGVGTRPVPPPPAVEPSADAEKPSSVEPAAPAKTVLPSAEKKPVVKDSQKNTVKPKPETKKRAASMWFKSKPSPAPTSVPAPSPKPAAAVQKPAPQNNGLSVPVGR